MSVGELRSRLTALAEGLPAPELAGARDAVEAACGQMASAWHGSEHPSSRAALASTSEVVDQLSRVLAGLEEVKAGVLRYTEGL